MASNQEHAILDLGIDDLQFTTNDYKSSANSGGNPGDQGGGGFTSFPDPDPQSNRDTERIIDDEGAETTRSSYLKMSFYQKYFDVEDKDILNRLLYSMLPVPGKSFLQHHIRPKADLYGPFWTCVTLIFSIAISGNIADYFISTDVKSWQYDFHKVNLAATAVFSYTGLVPACLFGYLWWAGQGGSSLAISFVEMVCVYGYSLVIYIPVSILWLACLKLSWLQWVLVLVAASLSGIVLFTTIWPAVRESAPKSSVLVMGVVLGLHFLLATGFMLYFFHDSGAGDISPVDNLTTAIPVPANKNVTKGEPSHAALVQDHTEATINAISSFDPDKLVPADNSTRSSEQPAADSADDSSEVKTTVNSGSQTKMTSPATKSSSESESGSVQPTDTVKSGSQSTDVVQSGSQSTKLADPAVRTNLTTAAANSRQDSEVVQSADGDNTTVSKTVADETKSTAAADQSQAVSTKAAADAAADKSGEDDKVEGDNAVTSQKEKQSTLHLPLYLKTSV